jgi:hypothetical protein
VGRAARAGAGATARVGGPIGRVGRAATTRTYTPPPAGILLSVGAAGMAGGCASFWPAGAG